MKAHIKREQDEKKGLFGGSIGISFSLSCHLELTDAEKALVDKYRQ
jgi:hypothetical protein